jgi:signal transduction histidine kinase
MLRQRATSYALPFLTVGCALLFDLTFRAELGTHQYAPFLLAVIVTAFTGGLGPSLLATLLAIAAGNWFDYRLQGTLRLDVEDVEQLLIFVTIALCISFLTTRRQRAERELERANRELRELDRAKDQFIATISHELRTPMTVIIGWAEILKQPNSQPLLPSGIEAIKESAYAQARLIEDLLDMSRLTLGKLHLERAPVAMTTTVQRAASMVEPQAKEKRIELRVALPSDPCVIDGDEVRLQQICWNLLSNAVKFTPAGGRIDVALTHIDHTIELTVSDSGEGIAPELLPRIFEPFRQGNGGAAKGGLGLGLAIVRQLVAMHHGEIAAESEGPGKGARFIVRLQQSGAGL